MIEKRNYLTYQAEKFGHDPEVILAGRRINDGMGKYIAEQTVKNMVKTKYRSVSLTRQNHSVCPAEWSAHACIQARLAALDNSFALLYCKDTLSRESA